MGVGSLLIVDKIKSSACLCWKEWIVLCLELLKVYESHRTDATEYAEPN